MLCTVKRKGHRGRSRRDPRVGALIRVTGENRSCLEIKVDQSEHGLSEAFTESWYPASEDPLGKHLASTFRGCVRPPILRQGTYLQTLSSLGQSACRASPQATYSFSR